MTLLHGITVGLVEKVETGADPFGNPIYTESIVDVENVLVGNPTTDDIVTSTNLYGKKAVYTLAIPKGDTHNWLDTEVVFFGRKWRTFGFPTEGIEDLIPLDWNKKIMVEAYE